MLLDDGTGKAEGTEQLAFRLPKSLADYVTKRAGPKRGAKTRVVENAIDLHRALYKAMGEHKRRLQQYAIDEGLDWEKHEPDVYVRLMLLGLETAEKGKKS